MTTSSLAAKYKSNLLICDSLLTIPLDGDSASCQKWATCGHMPVILLYTLGRNDLIQIRLNCLVRREIELASSCSIILPTTASSSMSYRVAEPELDESLHYGDIDVFRIV